MRKIGKNLLAVLVAVVATFSTASSVQAVSLDSIGSLALDSVSDTFFHMEGFQQNNRNYAVIAAGNGGLLIVDITDPANMELVSQYNTTGTARDVVVSGNYAYVADGVTAAGLSTAGKMFIFDISDVANPSLVGTYTKTTDTVTTVALSGTNLFVGTTLGGVRVIDVTNPAAPTEIGALTTDAQADTDIVIKDNRLYLLQASLSKMTIVNIDTPSSPAIVTTVATAATANELYINESTLYVANGDNGITVYDLTNLDAPANQGTYNSAGVAMGVALVPNSPWVFVADAGGGIDLVDFSDLTNATVIGEVNADEYLASNDVIYSNGVAYVLSNGVQAVQIKFNFEVEGSSTGKVGKVIVTESGNDWCTFTAYDDKIGARPKLGDMNGDGIDDIAVVPKDAVKKPKLQFWNAMDCTKFSQKKLSDSDKKLRFLIAVGDYFKGTAADELVAAAAYTQDGVSKLRILSYFVNSSNKYSQKAKVTENPTLSAFTEDGIKVRLKTGQDYPIIVQSKDDSSKNVKYKLKKKDDGSYKLKKKD